MSMLSYRAAAIFLVGLMVLAADAVSGQDYPNKAIRILTTAPGSGSDFAARLISQGISGPLGQPLIVDNRPSFAIAAETVSKAPRDGYTLFVGGAALWILPLLQKAPYDVADFAPVSLISREVFIIAVHPSVPANSVQELVALAKAKPGQLNYGSGPSGTTSHLAGEFLKSVAGINIVWVPYKATSQAITAVMSGEIQLTIFDVGLTMPHVKLGKLRALAITSATPSQLAPGMPTAAASGLPGYEATGMTGILAPADTPGAIISRLNHEIVRVLNQPDIKERFLKAGVEAIGNSPEQFTGIIKSNMATTAKVIKDAGIKVD